MRKIKAREKFSNKGKIKNAKKITKTYYLKN